MEKSKLRVITLLFLAVSAGSILAGCGGGGGSSPAPAASIGGQSAGSSVSKASVGLFVTDAPSGYSQVSAIINSVTLLNSANGQTCTVISSPVNMDLANLSDVMELVRTSDCPAGSFDTVRVVFSNAVGLTDSSGTSNTCAFTSFSPGQPASDTLSCSGNNCIMNLYSQVNAVAGQNNRLGLDFDLSNFTVTGFGSGACSMTMRVNPLDGPQIDAKGYPMGIMGAIANASGNGLTLNTGTRSFFINGAAIGQPDFLGSMQMAWTKGIPAFANCMNFDFNAGYCQANQVMAVATGLVSNVDSSNHTFMLTLDDGTQLNVGFSNAYLKGLPADGQVAVVRLLDMNTSGALSDAYQVDNIPSAMGPRIDPGFSPMSGGNNGPGSGYAGPANGGNMGPSAGPGPSGSVSGPSSSGNMGPSVGGSDSSAGGSTGSSYTSPASSGGPVYSGGGNTTPSGSGSGSPGGGSMGPSGGGSGAPGGRM